MKDLIIINKEIKKPKKLMYQMINTIGKSKKKPAGVI
jgi:hypothetical protein